MWDASFPVRLKVGLVPIILLSAYAFDLGLTAVFLWGGRVIDLAHYTFIPFLGVNGYLFLRVVLLFLLLWCFRLAEVEKKGRKILEALAAYYLTISAWNVIFLAYHA